MVRAYSAVSSSPPLELLWVRIASLLSARRHTLGSGCSLWHLVAMRSTIVPAGAARTAVARIC